MKRVEANRGVGKWTLAAVALAAVSLVVVLTVVVWQSPSRGDTLIRVLETLLTGPVIFGALLGAFGLAFSEEIRTFLSEIRHVAYGQASVTREQARVSAREEEEEGRSIEPVETPTEIKVEDFERMRGLAILWWLRFLRLYLVPNSIAVLGWLRGTPATREWFHLVWKPQVPSRRERDAILEALQSHNLIRIGDDGRYYVTPDGDLFLGSLPKLAGPAPVAGEGEDELS